MKHEPLGEAELDELDEYLLSLDEFDDSMDISMLDGFFTAIVSGQRLIPPSEWMPWVWDAGKGEQEPAFESEAQAGRILGLMMGHMNSIVTTLMQAPDQFEPLLMENPNDGDPIPIIDEWCVGFVTAMGLDEKGWASVPPAMGERLDKIRLYGSSQGWKRLEQMDLSLDEHRAIADGLAETVRQVHAYFLEQRSGPARGPARKPDTVGRNEPCPCGSGKKYKRCHGSA
jgi:uncharacterized protein